MPDSQLHQGRFKKSWLFCSRGAAHKETIRSGKLPGYSIVKTALTDLKLDKNREIKDYYAPSSDRLLYEALQAQLKRFGGDGKKAFAQPFYKPKWNGTPGPVVNKVKTYGKSSLNVAVCGGIADNGGMVRIDVFHVEDDGYYFIPIYAADTVKEQLPQKAVVAYTAAENWREMRASDFLFSLYAGDLIKITAKKPVGLQLTNKDASGEPELQRKEWMLYYVSAGITTGSITVTTHDRKYEVDPLGEYHKVHIPEKRQTFENQCFSTGSVNRFMDGRVSAIVRVTTEFLFSPPLCAFAIRSVI